MRSLSLLSLVLFVAGCQSGSGPQGPQGDQGPVGPVGAAGPAGAKGDKGDKGDPGAMGAMGVMGTTGPPGPQGVQGAPGQVLVLDGGAVNGPPGASVVVTPEGPSATCPAGGLRVTQLSDAGVSLVCNGLSVAVTALPALSTQCPSGGVLLGLPDGGATALCNGAQGPQGNVGPAGGVGPAGPVGPMGPMGAAGPMGLVGAQGPAGPIGPAGNTGPSGPMGTQGLTGLQGPAGPVGPAGGVGPAGAVLLLDGGVVGASDRIDFAGFTSVPRNGNLGGIPGANALCNAEFAGSYFCPESDFRLAESNAAPGASGAWVDDVRNSTTGQRTTFRCDNATTASWTFGGASDTGDSMSTTGGSAFVACDQLKPLACCRRAGRTVVRGLTSATFTGDLGGIPGANAKCSAQYPGSFFCAENDYRDAESAVVPPATGAWLDDIRSATTGLRTTFRCDNGGAATWTFAGASDTGVSLSPTGGATFTTCDQVKPLVCCQYR